MSEEEEQAEAQVEEVQAQIDQINEILLEDRLNNIENIRREALDQQRENSHDEN